jgi:hypothetical protein
MPFVVLSTMEVLKAMPCTTLHLGRSGMGTSRTIKVVGDARARLGPACRLSEKFFKTFEAACVRRQTGGNVALNFSSHGPTGAPSTAFLFLQTCVRGTLGETGC